MRPALASLLLLLAAACAPQQGTQRTGAAGAHPPDSLQAQAARLPAEVARFTRGGTTWHEPERPGFGVSVDYAAPSRAAVATVSLYDRGEGPVSDGPAEPRLARELDAAVAEVLDMTGTRTRHRLSERERTTLAVPGGDPLTCARLEGTYGRQEVRNLVCLAAAAGRFVKVQIISPQRTVVPVDPEPFLVGVTQAARGG